MNILETPRKKRLSPVENDLIHCSLNQHQIRHTLTDSVFSYVWWIEDFVEYILTSPYQDLVVIQLPPEHQDEQYLRQLGECTKRCLENFAGNADLNKLIRSSVDNQMSSIVQYPLACENLEAIKTHFYASMDPFKMLLLERSITFHKNNVLEFYTNIDGMTKMYRHIFGMPPADALVVLWMMTSLSNDSLGNADVLAEIHLKWPKLHNDPQAIRLIINHHLRHRRGGNSRYIADMMME